MRPLSWSSSVRLGIACLLSFAGCGGGPSDPDSGPDRSDAAVTDAGSDAGVDTTPPRVTSTLPRNGAELVSPTEELEIRFNEPVEAASGTVTAVSGGTEVPLAERSFEPEGNVLRVRPAARWPGGARVDVRVEGFVDGAGNVQEEAFELVFTTSDDGVPVVLETTPAEGATGVDPGLEVITIRFSEPMNAVLGTVTLEGGAGELGDRAWASDSELRIAVSGLEPGTSYRVLLDGFEDRAANPLDGAPVLGDGAIDFTTTPDTTPPTVVDSNPTNGQLDIDVVSLRRIEVTFSEPMDTSVRTAELDDGTSVRTLTGNWSLDATVLTFEVAGRVSIDATSRLDLSAMRDRAGNALDGSVNLTDGALVFTTSPSDENLPFVVFTSPVEGAANVDARHDPITIHFSEAMDTSITSVELVSATETRTLEGTWNAAGTRLTLPTGGIRARTAYTIDLRGFTDATGNALDAAHPYLGDGVLDFTSGAPTGESCHEPFTIAEATTETTATGTAYVWHIEPAQLTGKDHAFSCNPSTSAVIDGVIVYEKTTPDLAGGGTALRITASNPDDLDGVMVEVARDVCDPAAVGGGLAAREVCIGPRLLWVQHLDVPAGTYYVRFANEGDVFFGATIRIEEVPSIPEGESCADPIDSSSSGYSSPAPDEHEWIVPHGTGRGVDYGGSTRGDGSIPCYSQQGPDAVVRIDKARSSSILDVYVEPFPASSLSGGGVFDRAGVVVDLLDACDPREPTTTSLMCAGRVNTSRRFQVRGAAGDYYLWLAANNPEVAQLRTTVRVREVDPGPGETCETAIPITAATSIPVTPSSTAAYFPPSCVPTDGGITWYRFTPSRELSIVSVQGGPAPLALVDAASGAELGCIDDASVAGIPRRAAPGGDICIAVPTGAGITGLSIRELDWRGVAGAATDLNIARPIGPTGTEISITGESFLAVTPTQIYLGINPNSTSTTTSAPALLAAPRSGNTTADRLPLDRFTFGNDAVAIGESLFSVEETNRPERLHRLIDSTGSMSPTPWDTGSAYDSPVIHAMALIAGTNTFILADAAPSSGTTPTTFYTASATTPGAVTRLGQNTHLKDVRAIAADASWIYVIGLYNPGSGNVRGIYRIPAEDVTAVPQLLAPPDLAGFTSTNGSMVLDATRDILYFRTHSVPRGVHAIFDASTAAPIYAGPVIVRGGSADFGLALDPSLPALFMFETETVSTGTIVEVR